MITGVPAVTENPLASVTTSVPVESDTARVPSAAAGSMFKTAVAVVVEVTVSEATVTPAPKVAVVVPCTKCVYCPVIATDRFCWPCCPVFGLTVSSAGVPAVTVNLLASVTSSIPVVAVTLRVPVAAAGSKFSVAVALVGDVTVSEATVTLAPKLAVVVP